MSLLVYFYLVYLLFFVCLFPKQNKWINHLYLVCSINKINSGWFKSNWLYHQRRGGLDKLLLWVKVSDLWLLTHSVKGLLHFKSINPYAGLVPVVKTVTFWISSLYWRYKLLLSTKGILMQVVQTVAFLSQPQRWWYWCCWPVLFKLSWCKVAALTHP